jgi:SPP1 gp7 family putative phage head morphogenesis protein
VIVELGGRPLTEARDIALRFLEATKPRAAAVVKQARTAKDNRLEALRMRQKIAGTKKMRAAILDALGKLREPVLGALHLREDDSASEKDQAAAKRYAKAANLAAAGWDDAIFYDAVDEIVREMFDQGAEGAAAEVGVSFDLVPKRAVQAVLDDELAFSKQFVEREQIALRSMIAQSLQEGSGAKELAAQISAFFADGIHYVGGDGAITRTLPDDFWAEQVARTETSRAYNAGHLASYGVAGVEKIKWLTAADERVCPECEELEGLVVNLGDDFGNSGESQPPIHPSDRCTTVAVMGDDAAPDDADPDGTDD